MMPNTCFTAIFITRQYMTLFCNMFSTTFIPYFFTLIDELATCMWYVFQLSEKVKMKKEEITSKKNLTIM